MRGRQVMLDHDLAALFGISTGQLNRIVKRNGSRFPEDFHFRLSPDEDAWLRSGHTSAAVRRRNHRYLPHAFTLQGVTMIACLLGTSHAVATSLTLLRPR
jgi:hypothetical protein